MSGRRTWPPAAVLLALALLTGGPARAGGSEILFTASATGTAVHGFYDHKDLFPVHILDLSSPYTEAHFEPGPTSSALGSFLWEPEAAELPAIFCQFSNGKFCNFPDYPFQAQASYPSSGEAKPPPRLSVEKKGAPLQAHGADETATATGRGSKATATVVGLDAIPMNPQQARAASQLATALALLRGTPTRNHTGAATGGLPGALPTPSADGSGGVGAGGRTPKTSPWLVSIGAAASQSTTTASPGGAAAQGFAAAKDIELLGGQIVVDTVRGEATATIARAPQGSADARVAGVSVGGFRAQVGPDGIRIQDHRLGGRQLATLQKALDGALRQAGIELRPGRKSVRSTKRAVRVEAYAFSLEVHKQVTPSQAPQGAGGADVLEVPLGYASAKVQRSRLGFGEGGTRSIAPPPPAPPASGGFGAPPASSTGGFGSGSGGPARLGPGTRGGGGGAPKAPAPRAASVQARPESGTLGLGVPAMVVGIAIIAAAGAVAGLTWLKTMEVLIE